MEARQTKNRARIASCLIFLACILLLSGCLGKQQAQPSPGAIAASVPAGDFGGQWWDFYKRGTLLAERGQHREAMADFREAIAQRDKDQWQAEIDSGRAIDYFPHREIGILHVASKEYNKAILELENSMASASSARASFFLNQARAGKTDRDAHDNTAPEILFAGSTAPEVTSNCSKVVSGVVSDDTFVAALTVAGQELPMAVPEKSKVFKTEVLLTEGKNSITAVATDLAGNIAEKSLEISCDRQGPLIEIEQQKVANDQVSIRGNVSDNHELGSLSINGDLWPITGKAAGYNFEFTLPDGRITIIAADRAGNVTGARVRRDELDFRGNDSLPLPAPQETREQDTDPPVIRIEGLGSEVETSSDTVQLAGQISDASLLVYISVNGEEILNRKGRSIYFSQSRPLGQGRNSFRIIAADAYGNKARHTLTVNRMNEPARQMEARLRLALLPFTGISDAAGSKEGFMKGMRKTFLDQARFNLVEEEQVIAACRELHFNLGAPLTPQEAAKVGQTVGAEAVLTGRVVTYGAAVEIVGQLIDTDSGALMARNDVFGYDPESTGSDGLFAGLADRFSRDFPLAEGALLEVRDREVVVNIGAKDRLRALARLICYRVGPPARHPVTGVLLPAEPEFVGEVQVTEVGKNSSRARVLEQKGGLLRGDKVIAR
ncbi:MAG TPA: hypothetical protein DDY20_06725 [Desulfobulbaceae bacterium]|nr:hypothetical protein [Desulfobulbaceae bacterium]